MPKYSQRSLKHLAEAHPDMQAIMTEAIKIFDCTIIDGGRTLEEQTKNVEKGFSKTMNSKHLLDPESGYALAVDVMPWPLAWAAIERGIKAMKEVDPKMETARAYILVGVIAGIAHMKGIPIRQGADWDGDENLAEHSFIDLPHVELVRPRQVSPKPR